MKEFYILKYYNKVYDEYYEMELENLKEVKFKINIMRSLFEIGEIKIFKVEELDL